MWDCRGDWYILEDCCYKSKKHKLEAFLFIVHRFFFIIMIFLVWTSSFSQVHFLSSILRLAAQDTRDHSPQRQRSCFKSYPEVVLFGLVTATRGQFSLFLFVVLFSISFDLFCVAFFVVPEISSSFDCISLFSLFINGYVFVFFSLNEVFNSLFCVSFPLPSIFFY